MQARLSRFEERALKRRQMARDVMVETQIKKITAPDLTTSLRPGSPALLVIDKGAIPQIYWIPREPRLDHQSLMADQRGDRGGCAKQCRTGLEREGQVMSFSSAQIRKLQRDMKACGIRTRDGHELSYIEGWHTIAEANRIFGFDSWNRETVESPAVLERANMSSAHCICLPAYFLTLFF